MQSQILEDEKVFETADKNFAFLRVNWEKLRAQYPNKWIAIRDGRTVADAETAAALQSKLRRLGFDGSETLVEFVPDAQTSVFA